MAMRRRRSPPPPPPRALARACACARATTRPELGRSGGGGGAAQCNATTAAARYPRHHTHTAALGCLACAAFRPTVFAHGRRRGERGTTAATRGVMAGGRDARRAALARARRLSLGVRFFLSLRAVLVWLRAAELRTRLDARSPLPPHRALSPFPSTRMAFKPAAGRAARRRAVPLPPTRRAGRRPAAAPLVVVLSGRGVKKLTSAPAFESCLRSKSRRLRSEVRRPPSMVLSPGAGHVAFAWFGVCARP